MKPVLQTRVGGPDAGEAERGNCFAACMASIFEEDLLDLPDPDENDVEATDAAWNDYLSSFGLSVLTITFKEEHCPRGYTIGVLASPRGDWDHAVVCRNGEIVWDPHPDQDAYGLMVRDHVVFMVHDPADLHGSGVEKKTRRGGSSPASRQKEIEHGCRSNGHSTSLAHHRR